MEDEIINTSIKHVVVGNSKYALKKHMKHVIAAPPVPVDNGPPVFLWGVLILMIVIFISTVFFQNASEAKEAARIKLEKDEERKLRELRWEREENEKKSDQREQAKKEKMRLLEIEHRRLAKIEYQKQRSAKEATKDSLSDFL
jgi:hypothetical protein